MTPLSCALISFVFGIVTIYLFWRLQVLTTDNQTLSMESKRFERTLDQFLANITHELRTPIAALKGFTDLMTEWAQEENLPAKYSDALKVMKKNEVFLLEMVNSILNFSRLKAGVLIQNTPENVHLKQMLTEIEELFSLEAQRKGLALKIEIKEGTIPIFRIDSISLKQILLNLVQNALKFTTQGEVNISASYDSGQMSFEVKDTGIGIDKKDLQEIFKPFYQIKTNAERNLGGTGLGLPICKMLTSQLNGNIQVESQLGKGSSFRVTLPVEIDAEFAETVPTAAVSSSSSRVLVVEDSPDSLVVIKSFLEKLFVQISVATDGQEAVQSILSAEQSTHPFDIVLMDMQMPLMSGYQATRLLRQRGFKKPILAVTSNNLHGDREKCLNAGCTDYVAKPLDPRIFKEKVRELISTGLLTRHDQT